MAIHIFFEERKDMESRDCLRHEEIENWKINLHNICAVKTVDIFQLF